MEAAVREHCPECNSPYQEVRLDGRCGMCDVEPISTSASPHAQQQDLGHRTFVDLVLECRDWGAEHGYPSCKEYPQYFKLREMGHRFYGEGGVNWMQRVLTMLDDEIGEADGQSWSRFVEFAWRDIGNWAP